jgi:c-di-GMP-binding flagellar brake protein YcgR
MVTGESRSAPDGRRSQVFTWKRRRRARRETAGWLGRYALDLTTWPDWSPCRVVDVSVSGVGLELLGPPAKVGELVVVDLQLVRSNMARITLTGEVRHAATVDGTIRVGLRFVDVSDLQHALLGRLVARQKHERRHPSVVTPMVASRAD